MHPHYEPPTAVAVMALAIPMVVVPVALVMKYLARRREQQHLERMRAIEMGHAPVGSDFWPAVTALMIGAGVPLGACLLALVSTLIMRDEDVAKPAWIVAGIIGGAGVVGGTVLASVLLAIRRRQPPQAPLSMHHKPAFDPDVFDPVGHR